MITIEGKFQIEEWFDTSTRIAKHDTDLAAAQICLYALKEGIDPEGDETTKTIRRMRTAVKQHNRKFIKTI